MDASKKASVEKYIVLGLLVVFGGALWTSLKQMGILGASRGPKPAAPPQSVDLTKPLSQTLQDEWKRMDPTVPNVKAATPPPAAAQASATTYTASDLRDPLKSLLPEDPKSRPVEPVRTADHVTTPVPMTQLPHLAVQGLWWGSGEARAIINGQIYGVGDRVEGAVITDIGRNGVTVDYEGQTTRLTTSNEPSSGAMTRASRGR